MIYLDFSNRRVRLNGNRLSKSEICFYFDIVQPSFGWSYVSGVYSYSVLARRFKEYLLSHLKDCESRFGDCLSIVI